MLKKIKQLSHHDSNTMTLLSKFLLRRNKLSKVINLFLNASSKLFLQYRDRYVNGASKPINTSSFLLDMVFTQTNLKLFPRNICIIAELSIPQCKKYRVDQKVEMLEYLGYIVHITSWTDELKSHQLLNMSGSVIFYRVPAYANVITYFARAKQLGINSYFDVDDLIFDKDRLLENESLKHLSSNDFANVMNGAELYFNALSLADYGIGSTLELARQMQNKTGKQTFVLNNAIDSRSIVKTILHSKSSRVRIVYGSGTDTHNEDFIIASTAVIQILENFNNVDFVVYGYLVLDERFNRFANRILRVPFVDAADYYRSLANYDIAIAPLTQTIFNDCKSNIKFIESALYKVPCVCSNLAEFRAIIQPGINGFIANSDEEWYKALEALVLDSKLRHTMANAAYNSVMSKYDWQYIAQTQLSTIFPPVTLIQHKPRIILVNVLYKPDSFGGATIVVENLARVLHEQGWEVLIFAGTLDDTLGIGACRREEINGIAIIRTRVWYTTDKISEYYNPLIERLFSQVVQAFKPDLVHFHSIQLLGASLANVCILGSIPYFITLHDDWWFCERQFMINNQQRYCNNTEGLLSICATCVENSAFNHKRRYYLYDICDKARLLLAPSDFQRDLYIQAGFNADNIVTNKNGVLAVTEGNTTKVAVESDRLVFAYLGGKAEHKGFYWLDDAFASINNSDFILKIVDIEARLGGRANYLAEFTKINSSNIQIMPYFNQENIDEFFSDVDVLVFPSRWKESFGLTIREAMLRDVWVVSSDCGGPVEDIINGVNGTILPFDDKTAFINAIQNIIDNPAFYKKYINMNKNKIRLIEEQCNELISLYSNVINESI